MLQRRGYQIPGNYMDCGNTYYNLSCFGTKWSSISRSILNDTLNSKTKTFFISTRFGKSFSHIKLTTGRPFILNLFDKNKFINYFVL